MKKKDGEVGIEPRRVDDEAKRLEVAEGRIEWRSVSESDKQAPDVDLVKGNEQREDNQRWRLKVCPVTKDVVRRRKKKNPRTRFGDTGSQEAASRGVARRAFL
jgi:hypothetical protein